MKIQCIACAVDLAYDTEHDFYACPVCGGKWVPGVGDTSGEEIWRDEQNYKKTLCKFGGGGSKGKRYDRPKKKSGFDITEEV